MATFKYKTTLEQALVLEIKFSRILFQALLQMILKIIRSKVDENDGRVTTMGTQSHKLLFFLFFLFGLTYAKSL